jgi:tetratricopeptide (TPR) repeat protein
MTRPLVPAFLAVLVALACQASGARAAADPVIAIVHVTAYPMTGGARRIDDATLIVRGGRIVALAAGLRPPADARVIDGRGKWLVPGLVDAHMHCVDDPEVDFRLDLRYGITTVLNMAGGGYHINWRDRLARGTMFGPSLLTTGPQMDGEPPEGSERAIVHTPLEAAASVADQKRAGFDAVKVYSGLDLATYDAIIDAARRFGMHVVGHLPPKIGLAHAMAQHQAIAHAEELLYAYDFPDDASVERAVRLVADAHVPLTGTLVTYETIGKQVASLDGLRDLPSLRYADARVRNAWIARNRYRRRFTPDEAPRLVRLLAFQQMLIRRMSAAGVPIFVGTDASTEPSGVPFVLPGLSYAREIELLRSSGLTPVQLLEAATVAVPRWLARANEFGTLAPGSRADALLVDRDPLADSSALTDPSVVLVRGVPHTRDELQALVDDIPALFAREDAFFAAVRRDGAPAAIAALETALRAQPGTAYYREARIDDLAAELDRRDPSGSTALEELNVRTFPDSANAWDSLGETYLNHGDTAKARAAYERAFALDPALPTTVAALDKLRAQR